ncbi:Holliday junction resolvase RuvX [Candidatus Methylocalor cossyra]|uniref:Putative pre-16S rRNA nuclease n=1 Tax=Candidatus Methylocalor cossyra TaxID=3108543 RepID=A0ABP1C5D0_9GAMM
MPWDAPRDPGNATYLGFDFGERNIGVAVGQRVTATATALETIRATHADALWSAVSRLVRIWQPDAFVVGMPYNPEGEENPIVQPIRKFCRQLQERYQRPVYTMDETLSTKESQELFYRKRSKRSIRFADIKDELAAQLILQTWLRHTAGENLDA